MSASRFVRLTGMATRKPNAQGLRRFPQPMLKDHGLPGTRKGPIQTKKVRPKFHDMAVQVTGYDEIPEDRRMTREQHLGDASDRVVRAVSANTVHSEEAYRRKDDAEGDDASQLGEQFDDKEIMASEWVDAAPQKVKPTTPVIGDMKTYITKNAGVTAATVDEAYEAITNGRLFYLTPDRFTFRDAQTLYRELKVTYWEHHGDKVENYADEKRLSYRMTAALKNLKVLLFHNTTGWVALHGAPQLPKHQQWNWREQYWPKDATEVSFTDVLAINSSFQQWKNGIQYPGLKYKLHPHYNVYYPTQAGHIKLFRKWMQQYSSRKRFQSLNVADIGCGCGILAFLLGTFDAVKLVHATDINPAATESLRADQIVRKRSVKTLEVFCGDLLEPLPLPQYDLIVFNAPWLPDIAGVDHSRGSFDMAVSFPPDLYPRFFEQAKERLTPDGRIVVIGSDLSRLLGLEKESPVTRELRDNPDRFYCAAMYQGEHAPGLLKKDSVVPEDKNKGPGDSKASADTTYKANKWKAIATRQQKMQLWELEHEYPADIVNPEEQ